MTGFDTSLSSSHQWNGITDAERADLYLRILDVITEARLAGSPGPSCRDIGRRIGRGTRSTLGYLRTMVADDWLYVDQSGAPHRYHLDYLGYWVMLIVETDRRRKADR